MIRDNFPSLLDSGLEIESRLFSNCDRSRVKEASRTGREVAVGWCGPTGRVWAREDPVRRRGGVELGFGRAQERKEKGRKKLTRGSRLSVREREESAGALWC